MNAPGWYPDPSGDGTQRYWDGNAWGPSAPPPSAPPPPTAPPVVVIEKKRSMLSLLVLGSVALLAGSCVVSAISGTGGSKKSSTGSSTSSTPTTQSYSAASMEREVLFACELSVTKQLKDPDSAKFGDDWKALPVERDSAPVPERLLNAGFNAASGDKQYVATGSVNAKNSFGGYVGSKMYGCDAFFSTKSGSAKGIAYSLEAPG
jgi:hypothetical protein